MNRIEAFVEPRNGKFDGVIKVGGETIRFPGHKNPKTAAAKVINYLTDSKSGTLRIGLEEGYAITIAADDTD